MLLFGVVTQFFYSRKKNRSGEGSSGRFLYYLMYLISLYRSRSAARTSFSSAIMPRRANRQKMAAMMGKEAVSGNASACNPCWMSTASTIYQAKLTMMAARHSVACRGRCLNIKMAMSAMADASICMPKSSQPWKCTIPKMTAMSRKSDCLR